MTTIDQPTLITPTLALDQIDRPWNIRRDVGDVAELAGSIDNLGLIEPLVVRANGDGRYTLLAGFRRIAALESLGHTEAEVRVVSHPEEDQETARISLQLIENLQRVDLDPIEEASGYGQLKHHGWKQTEIAKKIGRSQAHVSKRLSLLKLPDAAIGLAEAGRLGAEALYELSRVASAGGDVEAVATQLAENHESDDEPIHLEEVEHMAKVALRETETAKQVSTLKTELEEEGVTLYEGGKVNGGWPKYPKNVAKLSNNPIWDIHKEKHQSQPCHAAFVYAGYHGASLDYLCTDVARHGPKGDSKLKSTYLESKDDRKKKSEKANRELKKKQDRARQREGALKEAAKSALSGRAPAKDKVLSVLADRWVAIVINDYGFDHEVLELLDITPAGEIGELGKLYEEADGSNRTKILVASVIVEMLDQVTYMYTDEKTDPVFNGLVDLLTDLGASIDIDGYQIPEDEEAAE